MGAGIAGLAAARTLRGWGAEVEIAEQSPAARTEGAGIYLPGNAVRALDDLGLREQVAARAVEIRRQRISDHRGRPLMDLATADLWDGVGPCLAMRRADLHDVLLAGAKESPIRWGRAPSSIEETRDEVRVGFADSDEGRYDLVVGADGVHSTVRQMIFGEGGTARPLGQHARRFIASYPESGPVWSLMVGRRTAFLTIPIGGGQVYCYCDGPAEGFAEPAATLLAGAADAYRAPIEEVVLPHWSRGLTVLVGDAAHATSPNMAEGAAMAVEDALVLADCLAGAGTIAGALWSFERRRRPRTDWVRAQTHRRDRSRDLPALVRNLVLGRFGEPMFHAHYAPLRERP